MNAMADKPNMKMTISITKEQRNIFKDLCAIETHGPSDQFRHILKHYLKTFNHYKSLLKRLEDDLEKK